MFPRGNLDQADLLLVGMQAVGFSIYRQRWRLAKMLEHPLKMGGAIHISGHRNVGASHAGIITPATAPRQPGHRLTQAQLLRETLNV